MARYTYAQLQDLWIQAGGSSITAPIAAAIAMAESGGDPNAVNASNSNGSTDRGLWQINSIHGAQSTLDPVANARAAVGISNGGRDWRPWCVAWSNGRCGGTFMGPGAPVLRFLTGTTNTGTVPTNGTDNGIITAGNPGPLGGFADLFGTLFGSVTGIPGNLAGSFGTAINKWLFYVAMVIAGITTMIVGLVLLILSTRTVRGVISGQLFPNQTHVVIDEPRRRRREPEPVFSPPPPVPVSAPPAPASAPPASAPPAPAPFEPPKAPKAPAYKPRHLLKVDGTSKRAAVRGKDFITPGELPPTKGYKPRRAAP